MKIPGTNIEDPATSDRSFAEILDGLEAMRKSLSPASQAFLTGTDIDDAGRGAALTHPYAQSAWIYACINILARNLTQIPFRISCGGAKSEDIVDAGPVVDLFNRPHTTMDRGLFWANIVSWDCLRGEFFVLPMDAGGQPVDLTARRSGQVKQMIVLSPDQFWHTIQGFDLVGWRFTGSPLMSPVESQVLLPEELIHARQFNPYLYWRGLAPLTVAMLAAQTDYASAQFMKGLMINNADTGVIVSTDNQVDQVQREQIMAALRDRKRKAGTADRPLFLWGGAKIEKPTVSAGDMEFINQRGLNRQEIGAVFCVPDMMLGFSVQKTLGTGAGAEQERYNFIEATITPLCRRLESALDPIVKSFGPDLFGWFDVDSLPVMQEARRTRVDTATKVFAMGVPFNEINEVYDLGFTKLSWGDKGYLAFNLQEAGSKPTATPVQPPDDPNAEKSNPLLTAQKFFAGLLATPKTTVVCPHCGFGFDYAAQPEIAMGAVACPKCGMPVNQEGKIFHQCEANPAYEASIEPSVKAKTTRMRRFFFEQRGRVLAKLALSQSGLTSAATKSLDDIFDSKYEDARLMERLKAQLISDLEFGGAQIFDEIGAGEFNLPPAEALAYLAARQSAISGINATTWDALKASLGEGLKAGDSYEAMADRVKAVYKEASDGRAETIAYTETNSAINTGRNNAMVTAGVTRKGWQTSHLEHTRATHIANEQLSQEQNGIGIEETWPNGCDYPGDPAGEPGETINCRCFGYALQTKDGKFFDGPGKEGTRRFLNFTTWFQKKVGGK